MKNGNGMKNNFLIDAYNRGDAPLVTESKLSRILQHLENPNSRFGVVSAFRDKDENDVPYTHEQNMDRHIELRKDITHLGLGYVELRGGFIEEGQPVEEMTYFVPNITKADVMELGEKYNQQSVLFKDPTEFVQIGTNAHDGVGTVLRSFKKTRGAIDLNKDNIKEFWSSIYKGAHKDKKFLFMMEESLSHAPWWEKWRIHTKLNGDDSGLWNRIL